MLFFFFNFSTVESNILFLFFKKRDPVIKLLVGRSCIQSRTGQVWPGEKLGRDRDGLQEWALFLVSPVDFTFNETFPPSYTSLLCSYLLPFPTLMGKKKSYSFNFAESLS